MHRERIIGRITAITLLLAVLLLYTSTASAAVVLNSSSEVGVNVTYNNQVARFNASGLDLNSNSLYDFFQNSCSGDQVIQTINPDGTVTCHDPGDGTGTDDQNLSEVLVQGNVANQSIEFQNEIVLGNGNTAGKDDGAIVIGQSAVADGELSDGDNGLIAIGTNANASIGNGQGIAIGDLAKMTGDDAVAIGPEAFSSSGNAIALGWDAHASGTDSMAIGPETNATAQSAVAIGELAAAPNPYETTFGNLGSEHMDVNVTGNATIHGTGGLTFTASSPSISGFFGSNCGPNEVVQQVWANGTYKCVIDSDTQDETNEDQALNASSGGGLHQISIDDGSGDVINTVSLADDDVPEQGDFGNALELTGEGAIATFDNASDLDAAGAVLWSNANDLDSSGNVNWENAAALTGDGAISSFANASDLDAAGDIVTDAITSNELDSDGSFDMGSLTVSNDATIQGDLFVVGNISNTNVQELNVNGSILPPREFDGQFDLGAGGQRWQNAYISGSLYDASGSDNFFENGNLGSGQRITSIDSDGTVQTTTIDHGNLNGLSGDDHSAYLDKDGAEAMSGSLDLGSFNISNVDALEDVDSTALVSNLNADLLDGNQASAFCQSDGSNCPSDETGTDDQSLQEVLVQGDTANRSINMGGNSIHNINTLSVSTALSAGNVSLGNGLQDSSGSVVVQADTGISVSGSGVAVDWSDAAELTGQGAIATFDNASDLDAAGAVLWSNADDLDSSGNVDWEGAAALTGDGGISSFSNASDLDAAGDISSFDNAADLDGSGNVQWQNAQDLNSTGGVVQSAVTQHEGAITITESQISDLSHYTSSDFNTDFSGKSTDDLSEGASNLYFTDSRAQSAVEMSNITPANSNLNMNGNQITGVAGLNVTNTTSNTQIADFAETGITFHQPLSVESSGPLSVGSGIDLTDGTSNTIDSYSTLYLQTSSGSPSDIVLQPMGQVGVQSNLSVGNNQVHDIGGLYSDAGSTSFFGSCSGDDYVTGINADGTVNCGTDDTGASNTDDQNLSEVLVQGNVANTTLDMDGNEIRNINEILGSAGGSAGDAVYAFEGDQGTGMYSSGSSNLDFATTSTQALNIDGNQNVDVPNGYLQVNGVSGTASTDGSNGIGAPSVYTNIVEAQSEKGGSSTYIELGSSGPNAEIDSDEIGFITQGVVQAEVNSAGNLNMTGNAIDMDGGQITGLPNDVQFETDGDLDMSGRKVYNIGSTGTGFTGAGILDMQNYIDMHGNWIHNVDDINFSGGTNEVSSLRIPHKANAHLDVHDTDGTGDIARFHDDGDVEFPAGDLSVETGQDVRFNGLSDGNWRIGRNIGSLSTTDVTGNSLNLLSSGVAGEGVVIGANGGNSIAEFNGNTQDVTIPNGDLDMSSNGGINNIGNSNIDMQYDTNDNRFEVRSGGSEDICIGNC